jgi:hypothetical protein
LRKLTANIDPAEIGRITVDEALALAPTPEGGERDKWAS